MAENHKKIAKFSAGSTLTARMNSHNSVTKCEKYRCEKCDYTTALKRKFNHHTKTPHIKCEICLMLTTQPRRHNKSYHVVKGSPKGSISKHKRPKKFKCDLCDYRATEKKFLVDHINVVHLQDKSLKCDKCDYATGSRGSYDLHMRTQHDKCEVCSFVATEYQLLRHKKKLGHGVKSIFKCDTCIFEADTKKQLRDHVRSKHFLQKCDKCDDVLRSHIALKFHRKLQHMQCEFCPFVSANTMKMKRHLRSWHWENKPPPEAVPVSVALMDKEKTLYESVQKPITQVMVPIPDSPTHEENEKENPAPNAKAGANTNQDPVEEEGGAFESILKPPSKINVREENSIFTSVNNNPSVVNQTLKENEKREGLLSKCLLSPTPNIDSRRPSLTYSQLIAEALMQVEERMLPLSEIIRFISHKYPFFQMHSKVWQNAIRHYLTLNPNFVRIQRPPLTCGRGFWHLKDGAEINIFKRTRHSNTTISRSMKKNTEKKTSSMLDVELKKFPILQSNPDFQPLIETFIKMSGNGEMMDEELVDVNEIILALVSKINRFGVLDQMVKKIINRHHNQVTVGTLKVAFENKIPPLCEAMSEFRFLLFIGIVKEHFCSNISPNIANKFKDFTIMEKCNDKEEEVDKNMDFNCEANEQNYRTNDDIKEGMVADCHRCHKCEYTANRKEHLDRHVKNVHGDERIGDDGLSCRLCPFVSSTRQGLTTHLDSRHGNRDKWIKCEYCDFKTEIRKGSLQKYSDMIAHLKEKHPLETESKKCQHCEHVSLNKKLLHAHTSSVHLLESERHCNKCDFYTVFRRDMSHHKKDVHGIAYKLVCDSCGKDFPTSVSLIGHKKMVHTTKIFYQCELCNFKSNNITSVQNHSERAHGKEELDKIKRKCQFCTYSATDLPSIENHLQSVHLKMATKKTCEQCQFSAYHEPTFQAHKSVHKNVCKLCDFNASSKGGLKAHLKAKHERQIMCEECDFSSSSGLEMRRHAKAKHQTPFDIVCDVCGKDFENKSTLRQHEEVHHSEVLSKDIKCNLCMFKARQNANIRIHWKYVHRDVNVNLKCQYCKYKAPGLYELESSFKHTQSQMAELESHLNQEHVDQVKLSTCDQCNFSAYHKPNVDLHTKSMHDIKCELCSYVGKTTKHIRSHINTHLSHKGT